MKSCMSFFFTKYSLESEGGKWEPAVCKESSLYIIYRNFQGLMLCEHKLYTLIEE